MDSVQVNIRTPAELARDLDALIGDGIFRNRTEAVNEGIRLVVRKRRLEALMGRMIASRSRKKKVGRTEDIIMELREEDDG